MHIAERRTGWSGPAGDRTLSASSEHRRTHLKGRAMYVASAYYFSEVTGADASSAHRLPQLDILRPPGVGRGRVTAHRIHRATMARRDTVTMDAIAGRLSGPAPSAAMPSRGPNAARSGAAWSPAAGRHGDRAALRLTAGVSEDDGSRKAVRRSRSRQRSGTPTMQPRGPQRRNRAGGWRRWCLLLAATVASTFLLSLSANQAFGQVFNFKICLDGSIVSIGSFCPPNVSSSGALSGGFTSPR
jgi:hypothetical protein